MSKPKDLIPISELEPYLREAFEDEYAMIQQMTFDQMRERTDFLGREVKKIRMRQMAMSAFCQG